MFITDAHLDLAYNATRGRDLRLPAAQQPPVGNEIATVGLPDLRAGGVGLVCATIFCSPAGYGPDGYKTAEEARAQALGQLRWYESLAAEGLVKIVLEPSAIAPPPESTPRITGFQRAPDAPMQGQDLPATSAILLLEGADALRTPDDVEEWFAGGLRIVGLAWQRTRLAGGTGAPGPLTDEGRALVGALDRFGFIHDASHLAEESFFDLIDLAAGPIIASHSNCRAIVGEGDRHLTDEMLRLLIQRGGVIGINFFDRFLLPAAERGLRRATLADVVRHIRHICDLAGNANHVGLGTDMDGGLGRDQIPVEIASSADLPRVADALAAAGFTTPDIENIIGENWRRFFQAHLPGAGG